MTTELAVLPKSTQVGGLITYTFDTAKNPSESGNNGRKAMRTQVIRQYMISIRPGADSVEFQKILLSHLGDRYPFAMLDYGAYAFNDDLQLDWVIDGSDTVVNLTSDFTPATGSRSYSQRVLYLDGDVPAVYTLNDSPIVPTIEDFGKARLTGITLTGTDEFRAISGQYLIPVTLADQASATLLSGGSILLGFSNLKVQEILEKELIALTS